jgi:hypothetical protein
MRTNRAIAGRRNETDETEDLTWVRSPPVSVEVEVGIRKTMAKPSMTTKE